MRTAQTLYPNTATAGAIDIIDIVEESLEISIGDLILNRVFVERHFSHHGLTVQGNKKELLLVLSYLIFHAIEVMDGLAIKVLKIGSTINTAAPSILITFRTSVGSSEHWALIKDLRCVPNKKNGYCQWLEITEDILARHNGTITVHNQPVKGLNAAIELPIVACSDFDQPLACKPYGEKL